MTLTVMMLARGRANLKFDKNSVPAFSHTTHSPPIYLMTRVARARRDEQERHEEEGQDQVTGKIVDPAACQKFGKLFVKLNTYLVTTLPTLDVHDLTHVELGLRDRQILLVQLQVNACLPRPRPSSVQLLLSAVAQAVAALCFANVCERQSH